MQGDIPAKDAVRYDKRKRRGKNEEVKLRR
jgi:hypothetical protein